MSLSKLFEPGFDEKMREKLTFIHQQQKLWLFQDFNLHNRVAYFGNPEFGVITWNYLPVSLSRISARPELQLKQKKRKIIHFYFICHHKQPQTVCEWQAHNSQTRTKRFSSDAAQCSWWIKGVLKPKSPKPKLKYKKFCASSFHFV